MCVVDTIGRVNLYDSVFLHLVVTYCLVITLYDVLCTWYTVIVHVNWYYSAFLHSMYMYYCYELAFCWGVQPFAALSSCGELHVYPFPVFINFWSLFMEC